MQSFGQKRNPLRLLGKRVILLSLLALVVAAASGVWGIYKKERGSRELRTEAEVKLADLEVRKTQLEEDIEKLKTPRGMEEALREQYRLAKNGEGLIIIVEQSSSASTQATSTVMQWFNKAFLWWR